MFGKSLFATALLAASCTPAVAAVMPCGSWEEMLKQAEEVFHQVPVGMGLELNGNVLQILVSPKDRVFTILRTEPDGRTCIAGHGDAWEQVPVPSGDPVA